MSWFSSASEWKEGLNSSALRKVEELENINEKLSRERNQKQALLDTLQQALDNQKRKTDEEIKRKQSIEKEVEHLERTCEQLQKKLNKGQDSCTSGSTFPSIDTGYDRGNQKGIELEAENRKLKDRINELSKSQESSSSRFPKSSRVSNQDDFWSQFSSQSGPSLSQKSPFKANIKTAIETSDENPFKAPQIVTPHKKGLEVSAENPFRTPRKYGSMASLPTGHEETIQQLERQIEQLIKDNESLRNEKVNAVDQHSTASVLQSEINSLKSALQNSKVELGERDKQLAFLKEQSSVFKTKAEESSLKLEASEQRFKAIQSDIECQRHNNEASKKHLEEKLKEKEREFNADASAFQSQVGSLEQQLKDLTTKLQQKETLRMGNENALQASIDKIQIKLTSAEKEKVLSQSRCGQLESSVAQMEKATEDQKKLVTLLRQEKEMVSAQVDSLKVKLNAAETLTNRLQSQLATSEQQTLHQKSTLEDTISNHTSSLEKERQMFKTSMDELRAEKDLLLKETKKELSNSVAEIKTLKDEMNVALKEKADAAENLKKTEQDCEIRLAGVVSLETKIQELEKNIEDLNKSLSKSESSTDAKIESVKRTYDDQILHLNEDNLKTQEELKKNHGEELKKVIEEKVKEICALNLKIVEMTDTCNEATAKDEKAKGEKLAVELTLWETEGKLTEAKKDVEDKDKRIQEILLKHQQEKNSLQEEIYKLEDSTITLSSQSRDKESELSKQLEDALSEINELTSSQGQLEKELEASKKKLSEMIPEIERHSKEKETYTSLLNVHQLEKKTLKELLEKLSLGFKKELDEKNNSMELLEKQHQETKIQCSKMEEENKTLNMKLETQVTKLKERMEEVENLKSQHSLEVKKLKEELNSLSNINDSLEIQNKVNVEVITDMQSLHTVIKDGKTKISQLENDIENLKIEKLQLTESVSKSEENHKSMVEMLESEIKMLKSEISTSTSLYNSLEKLLSERDEAISNSDKMYNILQQQNEMLMQEEKEKNEDLENCYKNIEDLKKELSNVEEEGRKNQELYFQSTLKVVELQAICEDYEAKLNKSELKLSQEMVFSQEKCDEAKKTLDQYETAATQVSLLKEANSQLIACQQENVNLKAQVENFNLKKQDILDELHKVSMERNAFANEISEREESLRQLTFQLQEAEKDTKEIRRELDVQIGNLSNKLQEVQDELEAKVITCSQAEEANASISTKCYQLENEFVKKEAELKDLKIELESHKEISELMRKETCGDETISKLCQENCVLKNTFCDLKTTITNLSKKNHELLQKSSQTVPKIATVDAGTDIQEPLSDDLKNELDLLKKDLALKESEIIELGDKLQDLFSENDKLERANNSLKLELRQALEVHYEASPNTSVNLMNTTIVESLRDELNQAQADHNRLKEKEQNNWQFVQELEEKLNAVHVTLEEKISSEQTLKIQCEKLRQEVQQLNEEMDKLKLHIEQVPVNSTRDSTDLSNFSEAEIQRLKSLLDQKSTEIMCLSETLDDKTKNAENAINERIQYQESLRKLHLENSELSKNYNGLLKQSESTVESIKKDAEKKLSEVFVAKLKNILHKLDCKTDNSCVDSHLIWLEAKTENLLEAKSELLKNYEKASNEISSLNERLESARTNEKMQKDLSEKGIKDLQNEINEVRHSYNKMLEENENLRSKYNTLKEEKEDLDISKDNLEKQTIDLQSSLEKIKVELCDAHNLCEIHAKNIENLTLDNGKLKTDVQEYKALRIDFQRVTDQVKILENQLTAKDSEILNLHSQVDNLNLQYKKIEELKEKQDVEKEKTHLEIRNVICKLANIVDPESNSPIKLEAINQTKELIVEWNRHTDCMIDKIYHLESSQKQLQSDIQKASQELATNASCHLEINELKAKNKDLSNQLETKITSLSHSEEKIKDKTSVTEKQLKEIQNLTAKLDSTNQGLLLQKEEILKKQKEIERITDVMKGYTENVPKLEAKILQSQKNLIQKDKELGRCNGIIEKDSEEIKKLKSKLKELYNSAKLQKSKNEELKNEVNQLNESSLANEKLLKEQIETFQTNLFKSENLSLNLKEKLARFQVTNKKLRAELAKKGGPKSLLQEDVKTTGEQDDLKETNEDASDVPSSSEVGEIHSTDMFESSTSKKAISTREAIALSPTKTIIRKKPGRKSRTLDSFSPEEPVKNSRVRSLLKEVSTFLPSPLVYSTERRVTRSSIARSSQEKRSSSASSFSSSGGSSPKRPKLLDINQSSVEGLPRKVIQGLNDIPMGIETPGVIRRPTTPLKKITTEEQGPRGPLRLLDPNFHVKRSEPPTLEDTNAPSMTKDSTAEDVVDVIPQTSSKNSERAPRSARTRVPRNVTAEDRSEECKQQ